MPASKNPTQRQRDAADVQDRIDIAVMKNKLDNIDANVKSIVASLNANYVTRDEFYPIKKIVYGMITLILIAVVGALMALVIKR